MSEAPQPLPERGEGGRFLPRAEAPQRSQERQRLAEAIEHLGAARRRLARAREAFTRLNLYGPDSPDRVKERAERALAEAKERAPRMMVEQLLGTATAEAELSVEAAEETLRVATQAAEAAARARALLEEEQRVAEADISEAAIRRDVALSAVVQSSAELAAVCDRFRAAQQSFWDMTWLLSAVGVHRLPQAFRSWDGVRHGVDRGAGKPWRAAITALEVDPDAALPGE